MFADLSFHFCYAFGTLINSLQGIKVVDRTLSPEGVLMTRVEVNTLAKLIRLNKRIVTLRLR